jgi:hypothetical protein
MRRGAGLHADEARRQRFEERQHLAAPELLANHDLLGRVDPVNLEHILVATTPDFFIDISMACALRAGR